MKILIDLMIGFLKVGCFSFGGGYGSLALIRDVVLSYGWLSEEELTYMIAVSESTPGPVMVNMATYIGSSQAGLAGSVVATLMVVLPAFLIILALAKALDSYHNNKYIEAMMNGIKYCVGGIILATGITMILHTILPQGNGIHFDYPALGITLALFGIKFLAKKAKKNISPILLIVIAAVLGIGVYSII